MKHPNLSQNVELLSRREVANILRVDPATIRRYERIGRLRAVRLNSRVTRYRRSEVEKLISDAFSRPMPSTKSPTNPAPMRIETNGFPTAQE